MTKYLLALLLCAPLAFAGDDDCKSCEGGKCESGCDEKAGDKSACPDTACAELATARKELSSWKSERKGLSRVERNALTSAMNTLEQNDAAFKALAPTFGAAADSLAILAALESAVAEKDGKSAKLAGELSATYRAMAQTLAGKESYPAPALGTAEELKAALKKCDADASKIKEMWAKAGEAKPSDEVAAALKLLNEASPRMRALALNANAAGDAFKGLKCAKASGAEGDMRPALMKTAQSLHAMAAPYFKNVKLEKPEKMAPAPST